jgi:hypothetical protein
MTAQSFSYLLRNVTYAGWVQNKRFQITERGNFEEVVPQCIFDEVQEVFGWKRRPAERHVRHNPDLRSSRCSALRHVRNG